MPASRQTVVVNCFAGPSAGKTTCAWEIASELKKKGIEAEYVSEYAKELVWDNNSKLLDGSLESQQEMLTEKRFGMMLNMQHLKKKQKLQAVNWK